MCMSPLLLISLLSPLTLKPFDNKSIVLIPSTPVVSAAEELGSSRKFVTFFVDVLLLSSNVFQACTAFMFLIVTYAGLNPV